MRVSRDKYELPEAVADTAGELARKLGVNTNVIYTRYRIAKEKGIRCVYVKVEIDEDDE
ncbi:MAG: hypothetical protein MJ007_02055 [Paludibacteraceae bacterium]|nr:hypothetical protein [Paludibacteraceae bacterium]